MRGFRACVRRGARTGQSRTFRSASRDVSGASLQAAVGTRALSDKAIELLRLGQYEELVELIGLAGSDGREPDPTVRGRLLEAAYFMCRACSEDRVEAVWHEEALSRIAGRENDFNRGLKTIFDLLGGAGANTTKDQGMGTRALTPASIVPHSDASLANGLNPRKRVRLLTKRRRPFRGREFGPNAAVAGSSPGTFHGSDGGTRALPGIAIYCLGPFQVYFDDRLVEDWPNGKGKAIFKFLVTQRERPIGKEILMDLFWPSSKPDAARNNLNVAIYSLRRALARVCQFCSVVLFRSDCYLLNPEVDIWVDYEQFMNHLAEGRALERQGELDLAMEMYRSADVLYRGEFLEEDRYEDWPDPMRRSLRGEYVTLLNRLSEYCLEQGNYGDCVSFCSKSLAVDSCCEESHRRLMTCWSRQGMSHLAVRQYHVCWNALTRELELQPSRATRELFERIRERESV